ncbi:hypothetical protein AB0P19_06075 [Microbacterium oleivorans]|uniref:hypothetical protein n=1 Tax=Microbacterium TaxID=33882 RepID=UPI0033C343C5
MAEIEIRGGRVVAVDTETLRNAAAQTELAVADADTVRAGLRSADRLLGSATIGGGAAYLATAAGAVVERGQELARALRDTAAAYEIVELQARAAIAWHGDARDRGDVVDLAQKVAELEASSPAAAEAARQAVADAPDPFATVAGELWWTTLASGLAPVAVGALRWGAAEIRDRGTGTLPEGSRLLGKPARPTVELARSQPGSAPATVADVARRVPGGGPGAIRVERYTMPDGGRRFALYLSGTRFGEDPGTFDWSSNVALYDGMRSSSYEASRIALEKAGAKPGDSVMVSGHSQGAMVASRIALEKEYEVPMIVGFGNPVQADVGPDTLQVDFRHRDDVVPLLAGGGHDAEIGAPGSMVVERTVDPLPWLNSHQMDEYTATSEMLDVSTDPRMDAVRDRLAELGTAESVEVFVYDTAEGVSASSADAG